MEQSKEQEGGGALNAAQRLRIFAARGKSCEECSDSSVQLHLHHLTYDRLGVELDADLKILCPKCHGAASIDGPRRPRGKGESCSFRLPNHTVEQISALSTNFGIIRTQVLILAIDRMAKQEKIK